MVEVAGLVREVVELSLESEWTCQADGAQSRVMMCYRPGKFRRRRNSKL